MKLNTNLYKQQKKTMNFIKNIFLYFRFYFQSWFLSFKSWFLKNWGKNSIYLGFNRAYNIPTLPGKVQRYIDNVFIRIFRVIGGLSTFLVLTHLYLELPNFLHLLCAVVASLHVTQVFIIYNIKIFYGIYTIFFKREQFEVRNSPLNRYASIISQALYCLKFGCGATAVGASFISGGIAYDALLQESGRDRVFLPMMSHFYTGVFGEAPKNMENNTPTQTVPVAPKEVESVSTLVTKYQNLSPEERIIFMDDINKSYEDRNKK